MRHNTSSWNNSNRLYTGLAFATITLLALNPASLHASTSWTGGEDNDWLNSNNWDAGLPDNETQAIFVAPDAGNLTINLPTADDVTDAITELQGILFNANATSPVLLQGSGSPRSALHFEPGNAIEVEAGSGAHTIENVSVRLPVGAGSDTFFINNSSNPFTFSDSALTRVSSGASNPYFEGSGDFHFINGSSLSPALTRTFITSNFTGTFFMENGVGVSVNEIFEVSGGTLIMDGQIVGRNSNFEVNNATLTGTGEIGRSSGRSSGIPRSLTTTFNSGAVVDPGRVGETGALEFVDFDITFNAGAALRLDLLSISDHDYLFFRDHTEETPTKVPSVILDTTGDGVALELNLLAGFDAQISDQFLILRDYDEVIGQFAGLPDGAIFDVDGWQFQINYGSDNTILTVIPEPSGVILLLASALLLLRRSARGIS